LIIIIASILQGWKKGLNIIEFLVTFEPILLNALFSSVFKKFVPLKKNEVGEKFYPYSLFDLTHETDIEHPGKNGG
jgi:hypothetical protein